MLSLLELGKEADSDKGRHDYLVSYESRFRSFRAKAVSLLEIGIMRGGSLRLWRDYFQQGLIYGLDACEECLFLEDRITTFLGRQENPSILNKIVKQSGPLDIIIDDGGHCGTQHVASFEVLWPHVKPGGWYCIEDAMSLYDICWTQPDDRTMLHIIQDQWENILRTRCDIAEIAVVGCGTQKEEGRNNGLIFLQKAVKEHD